MPTFRYPITAEASEDNNILKARFLDSGSYAHHDIDCPGTSNDHSKESEFTLDLGTKEFLLTERTIIISKVLNERSVEDIPNVRINYYLNDNLIVAHENPKSVDPTPRIIIKFFFQ